MGFFNGKAFKGCPLFIHLKYICYCKIIGFFINLVFLFACANVVKMFYMIEEEGQEIIRVPLPKRHKDEMYAVVSRVLGGSRMSVQCADGKARMARIPGSKKRKISRIREGDLLIICPWEIQNEKADVLFKYKTFQARYLSRRNLIPSEIDIF